MHRTILFAAALACLVGCWASAPAFAAAPVAADDVVAVAQAVAVDLPVLSNDHDADGDTLSVTSTTSPSHGDLVALGGGVYRYTPAVGFLGEDSFTYTVSDGVATDVGLVRLYVNAPLDAAAARATMLAGVSTLATDGYGGPIVAFGPTAHPLTEYPRGGDGLFRGWMTAIATFGSGRVVAIGDHQGLDMDGRAATGDMASFYRNGVAWLAGTTSQSIKIVTYRAATATWLTSQGFTHVVQTNEAGLADALVGASVFVAGWLGSSEPTANLEAIAAFVQDGGGLFLADFGWGYTGGWWNKPIAEAPGNRLLRGAGLGFPDGIFWDDDAVAGEPAAGQPNADFLLDILSDASGYDDEAKTQATTLFAALFECLPADDLLLARLDAFYAERIAGIVATPAQPLTDVFDQAMLQRQARLLETTPAAQVTAYPTAAAIYGAIPAGAPRVNRNVTIDGDRGRWQPLGLYAAPGELVTITVPPSLVDQGYEIRVHAGTDDISARESWYRPPRVSRRFPIDATTVEVASAFGGSLFVDLGGEATAGAPNLGPLQLTVVGAIEQPFFVLGEHTDAQWLATLRDLPAPHAVMVSPHLILSFPSAHARGLSQPTALMTWWNDVVALEDDLVGYLEPRTSAELIHVDVQTSAGSAHSGYPIQAWDIYWGNLADYQDLTCNGSWGDFHELGHNHQRGWWTFPGDGEVSVNVFSNYVLESKAKRPQGGWSYSVDPLQVMQEAIDNVSGGGTYSGKSDRWSFWFQLADGFGWQTYREVLQGYEQDAAGAPTALPTTAQEEFDQWFLRWSNASGYDMGRFMVDTWGLEVSPSARAAVAALPDWMPVVADVAPAVVVAGQTGTLNLAGRALGMDGVAELIAVGTPSHGALVANGNGTYDYSPSPGFVGGDALPFTVRSSGGNAEEFVVPIDVVSGVDAEYWFGIGGSSLSALTSDPRFPATADETKTLAAFDLPRNLAGSYGARVRGFLVPPTSGNYTFWISSDDNGALYLSSDDKSENATHIASVPGYTSVEQWTRYAEQQSQPMALVGGQRYYIEALVKEGGGSDHLEVAWSGPDGCGPEMIPARHLLRYEPPSATCKPTPRVGCRPAAASQLQIKNLADDAGDRLKWTWKKGEAAVADFGDPTRATSTSICVYDDRGLAASVTLPPAGNCGAKACWSGGSRGYKYADGTSGVGGINKVSLVGSSRSGRGAVQVRGRGVQLADPLPLSGNVTVQIANDDHSVCFAATYSGDDIVRSDASVFRAGTR